MPDSVLAPSPSALFPHILFSAYQRSRTILVDENRYRDGSLQNRQISSTSRRTWTLSSRCAPAQLKVLREFYQDRGAGWLEFYFYDLMDTVPKYSYDITATATAGRFICVFAGQLTQSLQLARSLGQYSLIEIG